MVVQNIIPISIGAAVTTQGSEKKGIDEATLAVRKLKAEVGDANRTALAFLGTGLGLLFTIMGIGRAVQSTIMALKEFGIVNETNEKQFRRFNAVIQVFSSWMTLMVTIQMMYLANQNRINNSILQQKIALIQAGKAEAAKNVAAAGMGAPMMAMIIGMAIAVVVGLFAAATAQFGFSGVLSRDTMFMAHAGERVNIGSPAAVGGGGMTINITHIGNDFDEVIYEGQVRNAFKDKLTGV